MAAVVLTDIRKSFGTYVALKGVSLEIAQGEFLTLLGPSGCGKSTLLRVIAGLEMQDAGFVVIGDRVVDGLRPKHRDIAMVFQSYALYPHMSVAQNMALPLRMRRLSFLQRLPFLGRLLPRTRAVTAEIACVVEKTAAALEISHLLDRKPGQLSGGQRQRVAVGRAMVRDPAVFLMDEPLSNLDAKLRVQMRTEIKDLHRRLGATFIYVTHDQSEAMTLSDRVAVMVEGNLLQIGSPQQIYADPADRRVAEFVGSPKINMLPGVVRDSRQIDAAGSTLALDTDLAPATSVTIGIRPEGLHFVDSSGANVLSGVVRFIEHLGSDLFVYLSMPGLKDSVIARLLAERAPDVHIGQLLHVAARPERALIFGAAGERIRPAQNNVTALRSYAG